MNDPDKIKRQLLEEIRAVCLKNARLERLSLEMSRRKTLMQSTHTDTKRFQSLTQAALMVLLCPDANSNRKGMHVEMDDISRSYQKGVTFLWSNE